MIRWYDWVAAIVAADLITTLLFIGFTATVWWQPIVFGAAAGFGIRLWEDLYCSFRLNQEQRNK